MGDLNMKQSQPPDTSNIRHGNLQPDLNEPLPSLYPVRRRQWPRQKARPVNHEVLQPIITTPFNEKDTAIQNSGNQNIPPNRYFEEQTSSTTDHIQ